MDWVSLIATLATILFGQGLISFFTLRETKKGMKLDNKEKEDNRWQKFANELQEQNEKLNERVDAKDAIIQEKDDIIADLRTKLDNTRTKCAIAELLRCETVSCAQRQPPLGVRNIDVNKIIETESVSDI